MVLQLQVWGPAFGLPSIDPACIAAVAYLNSIVPRDQWTLVADHDHSYSPQAAKGQFPLLVDADSTIIGFANIVSHIEAHYSDAYDIHDNLTYQQRADRTAFVSFLESTAVPLLDLYLYVSSENYNTTTSAAYTAILPWYSNYILPPRRRDLARARTAHLGLSSLDMPDASQDTQGLGRGTATSEYEAAKRAAGIPAEDRPKALNMGRGKGVGGLLGSPIYAARFKLDSLSNELLQPLADQLRNREYIMGTDKPSSLDCLAFGYLALLSCAPVPQAWIKETIQTKFPQIERYVKRLGVELLHKEESRPADVWSVATGQAKASDFGMKLPWELCKTPPYLKPSNPVRLYSMDVIVPRKLWHRRCPARSP
ncbi:hypothetical protein N0V90_013406 [Kalmusia sp. IMI 367209]|nr:hypothetical protein N0V90_013406 [Kalmusia sp. IMI 367209]